MGADARPVPWMVRRPRAALAMAAVALAAAVLLLTRFEIDPNIEHLLPPGDPTLELTRRLQGDAPPSRALVVILRAARSGELAEAVPAAARALRSSPHLASVRATRDELAGPRLDWYRQAPAAFLPAETLDRLRERLAGPERRAELESAKRRIAEDPLAGKEVVLADPFGTRWIYDEAAERLSSRFPARMRSGTPYLVFDQAPVAFLLATGREDSFVIPFSRALLGDVRTRLEETLRGTAVRFELAGGYVSADWQEAAMRRDMIAQSVSSAVLVVAFLVWFTRSFLAAHLVLVPVALAIACALAASGAVMGPLTPLVASAAAVLIAQGIDFPVHLFVRFRAERRELGRDEAMGAALRSLGRPFAGAFLTTVAAFLGLCVSSFPGFVQFGVVLSVGLTFCLLFSVVLFPALLGLVDGAVRRPGSQTPWALRPSRAAAGLTILVGLAGWGATAALGVRMDLDLRHSMSPGDPGMKALEDLERDLGVSMTPVFALVDASTPPDDLRRAVDRLRAEGTIGASDGPHALVASPESLARVAEFRRAIEGWEQAALEDLRAVGFRPEPFRASIDRLAGLLSREPAGIEALDRKEFDALRRSMIDESGGRRSWIVTLLPRRSIWDPAARARFDAAARAALGPDVRLYSAPHLPDHTSRTLGADLLLVMAITVPAVVLLTIISVGSVLDGLRALVPVTLAAGVTFGLAALLGGSINPMNLVAFPLVVGIGVDGGIHFMCRLRADPRRALADVGPGVWGSSATTILGFGSIAFSSTPGLVSMGILVAGGAAASLLSTLLVLPALAPESVEPPAATGVQ